MSQETTLPGDIRARLESIVAEAEQSLPYALPSQKREKKVRPQKPKTREESFRDLDGWYEEAVAGMPDRALARAANVSLSSVLEWRKVRGIKRSNGWDKKRDAEWAIDAFGDGYTPAVQEAESKLKGQWDLPEYVLRTALDYDQLTRALFFLHYEQGTAIDALARAFGLRERDVEMAIEVEKAHLKRVGVPCETCGRVCDPAYGKYCSVRCRSERSVGG